MYYGGLLSLPHIGTLVAFNNRPFCEELYVVSLNFGKYAVHVMLHAILTPESFGASGVGFATKVSVFSHVSLV
jgi:hypothetical protein